MSKHLSHSDWLAISTCSFSVFLFVVSGFCLLFGWILFLAEPLSSLWKYFFLARIHCSVYIKNSLLAAKCMCNWVSYLFRCKSRLIKSFFIIACGLQTRAAYIFCFFTSSKRIDDAQLFIGYILSTKLSSHSIFFSITCTLRHKRDYDEQKAVVVVKHHCQGCQLTGTHEYANASQRLRQPMFKCGLQSMATYINYTISCALQSSEFGKHIIHYRKKQTRTLRIRKQMLQTMTSWNTP